MSSSHLSIRFFPGLLDTVLIPQWLHIGCLKQYKEVEVLAQLDEDVVVEGFVPGGSVLLVLRFRGQCCVGVMLICVVLALHLFMSFT